MITINMKKELTWLVSIALVVCASQAEGALYWGAGVRSKTVSVCFVGNALTAVSPRVEQVLTDIKEFSYAANVTFNDLGTCPPSKPQPNGNDWYDGDIRVVLPNTDVSRTGPVPGKDCPMYLDKKGAYNGKNDGGSWSNAPDDLNKNRSCLYNLNLGDDPWDPKVRPYLNHTLHEFGHALGLGHEHERSNVNKDICTEKGFGGGVTTGFLTVYDRLSVMNYQFASCGINGNYDNTGLSALDRLGIHILYPENAQVAEFAGTTVLRATDRLRLQSAWRVRGAVLSFDAKNFHWKADSASVGNQPDLDITLPIGEHRLEYRYNDFLGRTYSYTGTVRVLTPDMFNRLISGPVASSTGLLAMTE